MQPILAIETSGTTCGVAIYSRPEAGETLVFREVSGVSGHAQSVLPLVDEVMAQAGVSRAQIKAVAFDQGPGAFTGVRLGCSVAQGMGYALQIPVVPVGALPALAAGLPEASHAGVRLVALDARMQEMYLAAYGRRPDSSEFELQSPVLIRAQDCLQFVNDRLPYWLAANDGALAVTLAGEGWRLLRPEDVRAAFENLNPAMHVTFMSEPDSSLSSQVPSLQSSPLQPPSLQSPPLQPSPEPSPQPAPHATTRVVDIARLGWTLWRQGRSVQPEHALPLYLRDKVAFTTAERANGQGGNPQVPAPQQALLLPMSRADLAEVVELERQSQAFPWSEGHFTDALAASYPAWVLRQAGVLKGFCVSMVAPDEVHLLVLAVSPESRRQGLGTQLLEQVYMLGRQSGAIRVLLEVRPSNTRAISFYRSQGFDQIGTRRGYYPAAKGEREDAWVMARSLHGEPLGHG